jgi:hypothetical protein
MHSQKNNLKCNFNLNAAAAAAAAARAAAAAALAAAAAAAQKCIQDSQPFIKNFKTLNRTHTPIWTHARNHADTTNTKQRSTPKHPSKDFTPTQNTKNRIT